MLIAGFGAYRGIRDGEGGKRAKTHRSVSNLAYFYIVSKVCFFKGKGTGQRVQAHIV